MPRRSALDLLWPVAGLDRSLSFQSQPPYTTPDALNVRTEDMAQYRERGGSRPGLGLAISTQLPGPIRLLTKVAVLKATWPKNYVPLYGNQLKDGIASVAWANQPTFVPSRSSYQGSGAALRGQDWGATIPIVYMDSRDTNQPYDVSTFLRPAAGELLGEARIFVGMVSANADPLVDGIECTIGFSALNYAAFITERVGGAIVQTVLSAGSFNDDLHQPGSMRVRIHPATRLIELTWRRRLLVSYTASVLPGHQFAFQIVSAGDSIQATKLTTNYQHLNTVSKPYRSQRRDILVAVSNGSIYMEDSADTLILAANSELNPDAELTAVDREQKLFIADYGAAISGTAAGTIAAGSYNTLQDTNFNFTTLGIDSNYVIQMTNSDYSQNEKQTIEILNADGGTYRLGFRGAFTTPLPQASQNSAVKSALEALPDIDTVNVTGPAGGPFEVEFTGSLAGQDIELLSYQAQSLTDSGGGVPAIEIRSIQNGAGGDFVLGSYTISSVAGNTITFSPAIAVASGFTDPIGNVTYSVVRAPKIFDPQTKQVTIHAASKGSVPAGCRLVCLYRDRIVYAASDLQPHVWFMSRQGDPFDWDYSQEDSAAALFAQASVGGQLADPITALIPHGDECLIIGCYNSLWIIRGDPGFGGTLDQLSRKIGIVGPHAWCRTPDDMAVFLSPDGLYVMPAGCHGFPTSLSRERLPDDLLALTQEREIVTMEYDTLHRGIHIFATKYDGSTAAHWWFDWEAKSFWRVSLNSNHEPFSLHERIAWDDTPVVLVGGRDGYIRHFHRDYEQDDQDNTIESYCVLGPFHLDRHGFNEGVLTALDGTLGADSGPVDWEVLAGNGAEMATLAPARESGSWSLAGLNYRSRPRVRGVAACVKVKNGSTNRRWFLERVTAAVRSAGQRRVR